MAATTGKRDAVDASQYAVTFVLSLVGVYVIPMLIISSIIIAMGATGLLTNKNTIEAGVLWIGGLVMTISTELASAGSFKLARTMKARGNTRQAGQVRFMGWILLIVVVTTICFEKFGVTNGWNDALVIVRITVAMVYALIADAEGEERVTQEQHTQIQAMFHEFRTQQVEGMITQCLDKMKGEFQSHLAQAQKNEAEVRQGNEAVMQQLIEKMRQENEATMRQIALEMRQESEAKVRQIVETMRHHNEAQRAQEQRAETPRPQPSRNNIVSLRDASKDALKAEAYRLNDVDGLSSYDIAERISKPAKTVQRWLRERSTGILEDATGTEE